MCTSGPAANWYARSLHRWPRSPLTGHGRGQSAFPGDQLGVTYTGWLRDQRDPSLPVARVPKVSGARSPQRHRDAEGRCQGTGLRELLEKTETLLWQEGLPSYEFDRIAGMGSEGGG